MSKRQNATAAPGLLEDYSQAFDDLFSKVSQRDGFRQYLTGLLLGSERNKTLTGLVNSEPVVGAQEARVQSLQWYLSESTWDAVAVNERRLELLLKSAALRPSENRSEEHTSELQSRRDLVCRLLLEKKKKKETSADYSSIIE